MNLNYQMDHILYQIFKTILGIFLKKHNEDINKPSIRIYVNKIENRITFKIKTGYYLELLGRKTIKLLESTENKTTKDKNGKNVPHFEIKEVVLVHCNIASNYCQQDSRVVVIFVPSKPFVILFEIYKKKSYLFKNIYDRNSSFKFANSGFPIKIVNHYK